MRGLKRTLYSIYNQTLLKPALPSKVGQRQDSATVTAEHMVSTRRAAAERARAAAMAFSKLSSDEQGIILGQLRNTLEPRLVMYFSSVSKELRALLTPAMQQQLRTDYGEAAALCLKVGMRDCKELREATKIDLYEQGLSAAGLATLAKLGSVLPALKELVLGDTYAHGERARGLRYRY